MLSYEYLYNYMRKKKEFFIYFKKYYIIILGDKNVGIYYYRNYIINNFTCDIKANKKDAKIDFNKLVEYLGGKENIIDTETNMSRFKVTLKDVTKANKEGIQKLGAKGIVEIDNQLKIILGQESSQIKRYIDDLKRK